VNDVSDIQLIESGPVRATIQIKKRFQLARFIQRIHLYNGIPRIDFDLIIDWNGKNKMVKVGFPLSVQDDSATYEIPYGTIKRLSLGEEHVAQKWVDISNQNYGVSLINDSRYGYDVTSNTIRLSVLRSPDHPVFATDEKGIHQLRYALYPHKGNWRESNTMLKGYEFNYPLIAIQEAVHHGELPATQSFINIEPCDVIVPVLKKAEDSDDLIIRIFETEGEKSVVKVNLSNFLKIDAIHKTDLMENEMEIIPHNQSSFEVEVGKYSIDTFKLIEDNY
jgi:alpha-mannosidase